MRVKKSGILARSVFGILGLAAMIPLTSWGAGGVSHGGGDAVVLADDSVVLADPYLVTGKDCGNYGTLNPILLEELAIAGDLFVSYGAAPLIPSDYSYGSGFLSEFVEKQILSPNVDYCFVDQLPGYADGDGNLPLNMPADAKARFRIGQTFGAKTYLLKSEFKKMSVREQAKTIIHERLHALSTPVDYPTIAEITDGISLALALRKSQVQGNRPALDSHQVDTLSKMMRALVQARITQGRMEGESAFINQMEPGSSFLNDVWSIDPNGGGLVSRDARVAPSAYVGIGVIVGKGSSIGDAALIVNAQPCYWVDSRRWYGDSQLKNRATCQIGPGATIQNSALLFMNVPTHEVSVTMGAGSKIENSQLDIFDVADSNGATSMRNITISHHGGKVELDKGAKVINSKLTLVNLSMGSSANIENVALGTESARPISFELSSSSTLENLSIAKVETDSKWFRFGNHRMTVPAGATIDGKRESLKALVIAGTTKFADFRELRAHSQ